jgi:hypothetical protein
MVDESSHNNPWDTIKEILFVRLEEQIIDISHNMAFLMTTIANNFGLFWEVGGSNSKVGSDEKPRDIEDLEKESKKEPEKEQPSSSAITPSQHLFKMEVEVDIKPYKGDIDVVKLNHWLQQLEVYFSVHNINEERKFSFARLK